MWQLRWVAMGFFGVALAVGCGDDDVVPGPSTGGQGGAGNTGGVAGGSGGTGGEPVDGPWPLLECDPLVPEVCGYPFPNNVFTVHDDESPTTRRVRFNTTMFPSGENPVEVTAWDDIDGFSAGVAMLAYFEGATLEGLPQPDSIDLSISATSPTVLMNFETGERIPHFTELDRSKPDDEAPSLMIRPVVRLEDGTRYIVAIRDVMGADGPIEPSPAFRALRDDTSLEDEPSVEQRRELYAEIFARLENAGVERADLQLAWDFTTASDENNTGWMVHMRDEALALAGSDGPAFTITQVDTDFAPEIAYRIFGTMTVPFYLDQPDPGATLQFGDDGLPEPNAATPTYEVEWEMLIPQSALVEPAKIVQYGHGLLGSKGQIEAGHFRSWMNTYNYAFFAVDLAGMASEDEGWIGGELANGRFHNFARMFDRMHQGVLNNLLAMRMVWHGFLQDPTYGPLLDGSQRFYHGISQGGIFGGVYMALSTDVQRGALGVMGQSYNLLLNRSVDFDPFFALLAFVLPSSADQQIALQAIQMMWDRVEPNGYSHHITENPLPRTPTKQVLMRAAVGDHQVTTLGAHVMARTLKAEHLETGIRPVWGLEAVPASSASAVYIEYDFGLPPEPTCNIPMDLCDDPHGKLRQLDEARMQLDEFFRTGTVMNFCTGGICSFPELSGCVGGETTEGLCD